METVDYVALTIRGETLDPQQVTERLQVEPTKGFRRGDLEVHPTPTKFGYWRYRTKLSTGDLNAHLSDLLDRFEDRAAAVRELAEMYEVTITIAADLGRGAEGELDISSSLVPRVALLNAQIRLYWFHDGDSESAG